MNYSLANKTLHLTVMTLILATSLQSAMASTESAEYKRQGRYTVMKTEPRDSEVNLLRAIKRLRFPAQVKTVSQAVDHILQGTGYRWNIDQIRVKQSLNHLPLPAVHRELGPLTILDALYTLLGPTWSIEIDDKSRAVRIYDAQKSAHRRADSSDLGMSERSLQGLDENIIAHHDQISFKRLVELLVPQGWEVIYEIDSAKLDQELVYHAETTRRRALENLFEQMDVAGTFYFGQGFLLVRNKE